MNGPASAGGIEAGGGMPPREPRPLGRPVASTGSAAAVAEPPTAEPAAASPAAKPAAREKRKRQPRYHVVLWNDDDHTYEYVVEMLARLFGHPRERGLRLAREVDTQGRVIVLTTTREHAELKRDQIHAFGKDRLLARSKGSMSSTIEPEANAG